MSHVGEHLRKRKSWSHKRGRFDMTTRAFVIRTVLLLSLPVGALVASWRTDNERLSSALTILAYGLLFGLWAVLILIDWFVERQQVNQAVADGFLSGPDHVASFRAAFGSLDVMRLGFDRPGDEYDSVADELFSVYRRGKTGDALVAHAAEIFRRDWGVETDRMQRRQMRQFFTAMSST